MKPLLFIPVILISTTIFSQKEYQCIYRDSTFQSEKAADSLNILFKEALVKYFSDVVSDSEAQRASGKIILQLSKEKPYQAQLKKVRATDKTTVIVFDRFSKEGKVDFQSPIDSFLLKNDELYNEAPTESGFSDQPMVLPRKIFQVTGKTKMILKYLCEEFISTDSTCRIWVTNKLPSWINPGIRTGKIKGAVLAFELKDENYFTKSEIIEIKEFQRR